VFVGDLDGLLNESLRFVGRLRHLATLSGGEVDQERKSLGPKIFCMRRV